MSDPGVLVTVNVHADTPMEFNVGDHTALLTLGEAESVTLEFQSVQALEQLQEHITTALATMHAQLPAEADSSGETTAGGAL